MNSSETVTRLEDFRTKPFWKHNSFIILVVFLSFVVGAVGYYWFDYTKSRLTTDDAFVESDLYPVNSRMVGFVKEVYVKENEHVKEGQPLVKFDDSDVHIELSFKLAKLEKAKSDMGRATKLFTTHALSTADFELAKANLTAMQADYDGSLLKQKFTSILAPVDGVVAKRNVQPGQFVQPGQGLMVVVPEKVIWIKANYKETQLESVKIGMKVQISIDAYPGSRWIGYVDSISPSSGAKLSLLPPENATGNFTKIVQRIPIRIRLDGLDGKPELRPGMSATTTILAFAGP